MCFILIIKIYSYGNIEKLSSLQTGSNLSGFSFWNSEQPSTYQCPIRGDKWIVITTIHYPTPAIHKFLNLTTPWNLIVIADRKTPSDWLNHLPS
ncbi:unnamed protein product, partial [Adineta ricciae]